MDDDMKNVVPNAFFDVDEFYKTLNLTKLCYDFVGMSGTIVKDNNSGNLIQWFSFVVDFEVTEKNYYVAIGSLASNKIQTKVVSQRRDVSIEMFEVELEEYGKLVPRNLGGLTDSQLDFRRTIEFCYRVIDYVLDYQKKKFETFSC